MCILTVDLKPFRSEHKEKYSANKHSVMKRIVDIDILIASNNSGGKIMQPKRKTKFKFPSVKVLSSLLLYFQLSLIFLYDTCAAN